MVYSKAKYLGICIGLAVVAGVCDMAAATKSLSAKRIVMSAQKKLGQEKSVRQEWPVKGKAAWLERLAASLLPKPEQLAALLEKAEKLAAMIKQDALDNGLIELDSVMFELGDPDSMDLQLFSIVAGRAFLTMSGDKKNVTILINKLVGFMDDAVQTQIILHELAHAYDAQLWKHTILSNGDVYAVSQSEYAQTFDAYYHLRRYADWSMARHKVRVKVVLSYEWYAQWQSIQWMKKYTPHLINDFKKHLERKVRDDKMWATFITRSSLYYPPANVMLKWL